MEINHPLLHFPRNRISTLLEKETNETVFLGKDHGVKGSVAITSVVPTNNVAMHCGSSVMSAAATLCKEQSKRSIATDPMCDPPICSRTTITLTLLSGIFTTFCYMEMKKNGLLCLWSNKQRFIGTTVCTTRYVLLLLHKLYVISSSIVNSGLHFKPKLGCIL